MSFKIENKWKVGFWVTFTLLAINLTLQVNYKPTNTEVNSSDTTTSSDLSTNTTNNTLTINNRTYINPTILTSNFEENGQLTTYVATTDTSTGLVARIRYASEPTVLLELGEHLLTEDGK